VPPQAAPHNLQNHALLHVSYRNASYMGPSDYVVSQGWQKHHDCTVPYSGSSVTSTDVDSSTWIVFSKLHDITAILQASPCPRFHYEKRPVARVVVPLRRAQKEGGSGGEGKKGLLSLPKCTQQVQNFGPVAYILEGRAALSLPSPFF
jgi:hypothetical protein